MASRRKILAHLPQRINLYFFRSSCSSCSSVFAASNPPSEEGQWKVLSLFIRGLYTTGDDMAYIAKNMSPDKKATATNIIEQFKKDVKAADKPAKEKDVLGFGALLKKSVKGIDGFLELLQDVPDEI